MIESGYVALWRRIRVSWLWDLSDGDFRLALTCLMMANWRVKTWFDGKQVVNVPRGAFVTSVASLCNEVGRGATPKKIRGGLKRLEAAEFLKTVTQKGKRYTLITIVNYSRYQDTPQARGNTTAKDGAMRRLALVEEPSCTGTQEGDEAATTEPVNQLNMKPGNQGTTGGPPTPGFGIEASKGRSSALSENDVREFVVRFSKLFRVANEGAEPTWTKKQQALVESMLREHSLEECIRRASNMFTAPPAWPPPPHDLATLHRHFDKFTRQTQVRKDATFGRVEPMDFDQYPEPGVKSW